MTDDEWRQHVEGWRRLLAELEAEGWQATLTSPAAPVQLEGRLPEGERFYFRARHAHVLLSVGGDDPADVGAWEGEVPFEGASYLAAEDGAPVIRLLLARYRADKQ
ncbi:MULTISPECIES: hypothetical protein [Amycolatopsis]|uniref:Uncharacterized protein n=1 Tax=Amycolatopsis thermalba TaxID=944492 RepID=A0ABY4P2Q4_9PSEU|nr:MULTISPECIES: hypothetical protein [Amycolatopsis]OXM73752.1 hypothetical protein CF166_08710 [Amycolatopsis sp. KNN50.9b]UQS26637.1 hypothetical protein L1857_29450 [Amycolatopsis thermalba]